MSTDSPGTSKSERRKIVANHIANSALDGYEADSKFARKQLEAIVNHEGSQDQLKDMLVKSFGGSK